MDRADKGWRDILLAALWALAVLHGVMLFALFTRTEPHPPPEIALFALAPFLGACLAIGAAALHLTARGAAAGRILSALFALGALLSFGPQKYFDPGFDRIWPAVLPAQAAILAILIALACHKPPRGADAGGGSP